MISSTIATLLLLVFAVDWSYVRDWVVVYLYKSLACRYKGYLIIKAPSGSP